MNDDDEEDDLPADEDDWCPCGPSQFPLRFSLFPNVPPYIRMLVPGQNYQPPLPQVSRQCSILLTLLSSPLSVQLPNWGGEERRDVLK